MKHFISTGAGRSSWQFRRTIRNDRGYVLMEALFAVFILSVGLVALLAGMRLSLHTVLGQRQFLIPARIMAENLLVAAESGKDHPDAQDLAQWKIPFEHKTTATEWSAFPSLQRVEATVSWKNDSRIYSVSLTTLMPATHSTDQMAPSTQKAPQDTIRADDTEAKEDSPDYPSEGPDEEWDL